MRSIAILSARLLASFCSVIVATMALADWNYNGPPNANAFLQTRNMTLELQCDRIRFSPAGYEDAQDIESKQGLSIRFMTNGSTEVGAFQVGMSNATIGIVDNYPVEFVFSDAADYAFVLDQIAANAVLNLSMVDQDISYGIFDLKGSAAAIRSLRAECSGASERTTKMEAPEGIVYCGGGAIKRQIEYLVLNQTSDEWNARLTINGETQRAMTSYSFFGNAEAPKDFVVALLAEDASELLIFRKKRENWLEFGDYRYDQCN